MENSLASRFRDYAIQYHRNDRNNVKEAKTNQLGFSKFYSRNCSVEKAKTETGTNAKVPKRRAGIRFDGFG